MSMVLNNSFKKEGIQTTSKDNLFKNLKNVH